MLPPVASLALITGKWDLLSGTRVPDNPRASEIVGARLKLGGLQESALRRTLSIVLYDSASPVPESELALASIATMIPPDLGLLCDDEPRALHDALLIAEHHCSAFLLAPDRVVTARHCVPACAEPTKACEPSSEGAPKILTTTATRTPIFYAFPIQPRVTRSSDTAPTIQPVAAFVPTGEYECGPTVLEEQGLATADGFAIVHVRVEGTDLRDTEQRNIDSRPARLAPLKPNTTVVNTQYPLGMLPTIHTLPISLTPTLENPDVLQGSYDSFRGGSGSPLFYVDNGTFSVVGVQTKFGPEDFAESRSCTCACPNDIEGPVIITVASTTPTAPSEIVWTGPDACPTANR